MDIWSGWTRQQRRSVAGGLLALAVVLLLVPLVLPGGARGADDGPGAPADPGATRLPVTALATPGVTPTPAPAEPLPAWTTERIADLPVPLEAAAVVAFDGRIWSIGGRAPDPPRPALTDVFVFDPATGGWSRGPSLPQPVSHAAAVSTGDELFVVGALNSGRVPLTTVLRLDRGRNWTRWAQAPPLPVPTAAGAAAWDGRRIVFGGGMVDRRTFTPAVWALESGRWTEVGQLEQARAELAAASDGNGRVWFMGGRNDTLSPPQLSNIDMVTDQGVFPLVSDIAPTQGAAGVLWPDVGPCLVGGHGLAEDSQQPTYLETVQCPNHGGSGSLPTLTEPRAAAGAAVLGGEVFVVGGAGRGFTGSAVSEAIRPASG